MSEGDRQAEIVERERVIINQINYQFDIGYNDGTILCYMAEIECVRAAYEARIYENKTFNTSSDQSLARRHDGGRRDCCTYVLNFKK